MNMVVVQTYNHLLWIGDGDDNSGVLYVCVYAMLVQRMDR